MVAIAEAQKIVLKVVCVNSRCEIKPEFMWAPLGDSFSSAEATFRCSYCTHIMFNERVED